MVVVVVVMRVDERRGQERARNETKRNEMWEHGEKKSRRGWEGKGRGEKGRGGIHGGRKLKTGGVFDIHGLGKARAGERGKIAPLIWGRIISKQEDGGCLLSLEIQRRR